MRLTRYLFTNGTYLILPIFLFLFIHKTTQPVYTIENDEKDAQYYSEIFSKHDHIDYPVYNPDCAKFTGNVDSEHYLKYTEQNLDFPVIPTSNETWPNVRYHFAVNTAPKSYLARRSIRATWKRYLDENFNSGKIACSASVRFYVGQTSDRKTARRLQQELRDNSDMVFIEFCDTYETLPLKTFNIMKYIAGTAPESTDFVVKIDDDVLPNFYVFFHCFPAVIREKFGIYGWVTLDGASRDKWDKYRISSDRFNGSFYPLFTHGPSYAIRMRELAKMLTVARTTPVIALEDVWFTGIVAEAAGVRRFDVLRFLIVGRTAVDLQHNVQSTPKGGFFYHNVGHVMMKSYWRKVIKCCGCCQHCEVYQARAPIRGKSLKSDLVLEDDADMP